MNAPITHQTLAANEPQFNERGLMDPNIPPEAEIQAGMLQQPGQSFAEWMETRVARKSTRRYDWDALKFQADFDPKYRRAQMRYVGTGGTGVAKDSNTVPSGHFTFSTMVIPAGNIGPSHIHYDVEEIFFVMRGAMKVVCEKDGQRWRRWSASATSFPCRPACTARNTTSATKTH